MSKTPFTPLNIKMLKGQKKEEVFRGGKKEYAKVADTFLSAGIRKILVVGYGSQAPSQASNLVKTLEGSEVKVSIGLREGSKSFDDAVKAGFSVANGTLGEMYSMIPKYDMVILLISDAAQVENYEEVFKLLKKDATIGFSHGFLLGHLQSENKKWPREDVDIIAVCPKGMGPSVGKLYDQGSGINCSYAVDQDVSGYAKNTALAWAMALHAPSIFKTTMEMEYRSDIFGERGVLLGGLHGLVETLYRIALENGENPKKAFNRIVNNITGPISKAISRVGLVGVVDYILKNAGEKDFKKFVIAYNKSYAASKPILEEIYDEVKSGNEIRSVVMAGRRTSEVLPKDINKTPMWRVGKKVKNKYDTSSDKKLLKKIDAEVAGAYIAMMMAQVDVLLKNGHSGSEIANESIIESVDSLNPFMEKLGVDGMVDNCSDTARRGSKKWKPRFEDSLYVEFTKKGGKVKNYLDNFSANPIHKALTECLKLRPDVDMLV